MGLFIFTPKDGVENAQPIRVHEYGHTIQSLVLGPLMLFVGIVSVAWGSLPCFVRLRREKSVPYTACFVEYWASKMGRAGYQRAGGVAISCAERKRPRRGGEVRRPADRRKRHGRIEHGAKTQFVQFIQNTGVQTEPNLL